MKTISRCTVALVLYQYIVVDGFTCLRFPAIRTGNERPTVCPRHLDGPSYPKRNFRTRWGGAKTISHCTVALVLYQYIVVDGFTCLRFPAVRTGSEKAGSMPRASGQSSPDRRRDAYQPLPRRQAGSPTLLAVTGSVEHPSLPRSAIMAKRGAATGGI